MRLSSNVFLIGPMGAGKTTIGRLLAAELRLEFKDTDREIEDRSGVDISWIFDREGEEGFRQRETAVLRDMVKSSHILLATGGGIILKPENRQLLANNGRVVYLQTSVDEQLRRTGRDKKRPLLQQGDPHHVLTELMVTREPLYQKIADYTVSTDRRNPKAVALELNKLMAQ